MELYKCIIIIIIITDGQTDRQTNDNIMPIAADRTVYWLKTETNTTVLLLHITNTKRM